MHLIAALAAGIRGAEDGTVRVRSMGTSTPAIVYSDIDGTVRTQPSTGIVLDANGGTTLYVNEWVDVVAYDSTGTAVRSWTDGVASPDVEVRSPAFTGTNRETGALALGQPVSLQSVLDLWETQNDGQDWKIEVPDGTQVTIKAAIASIYGIFINIKDDTYGAIGDDVTDDTTAIQAALTAAGTSKGIVIVPYGTYRITSKLTVPEGVSIWGVGAGGSVIHMDHATNDTLEFGAGTSNTIQEIRGICLAAKQANSGKPVSVTNAGARKILFYGCVINAGLNYTGTAVAVSGNGHSLIFDKTTITLNGVAALGIDAQNYSSIVMFQSGISVNINLYTGALVYSANFSATDCAFASQGTSAGAGTSYCVRIDDNATIEYVRIKGCVFVTLTNGPIAISADGANYSTTSIIESGNVFSGFTTVYAGLAAASAHPYIQLQYRDARTATYADNSATVEVDGLQYGCVFINRTAAGAGAQSIQPTAGPPGAKLLVIVANTSGGGLAGAVSVNGAAVLTNIATVNPATGKSSMYLLQMVDCALGQLWAACGTAITTT